jgi:hypothetical protein
LTTIAFNKDDDTVKADYELGHFSDLPALVTSIEEKSKEAPAA